MASADDTYEYPMYDVALAFGDSITQLGYEHKNSGWLTHLSNKYVRRMDILNRGFSGYNTTRARQVAHVVFPTRRDDSRQSELAKGSSSSFSSGMFGWLSKGTNGIKEILLGRRALNKSSWPSADATFPRLYPRVKLCILFFGANDAADPKDSRHTPLKEYPENLRYIVNMLRSPESPHYSPDTRILIVTPPAVGDKMSEEWFKHRGWRYGPQKNAVTKMYAEAAVKVAEDMGLPYVDMWTAVEQRVQESRLLNLILPSTENATVDATSILADTNYNVPKTTAKPQGSLKQTEPNSEYDGYDEFLTDGLHLNSNGNELLSRLVSSAINRNWPELRP
ncbi:isoamyl acetate-hydrolyzing esterase [Coemansia sp. RSA 2399]|nr:isoamyl acetate-hydrolyzing esterase [Coemansia sp. RSA 2399]KAJ1907621.1 isoamyl acetate-hydrolyzing esterase [Coemansia sp. IMI 209127]